MRAQRNSNRPRTQNYYSKEILKDALARRDRRTLREIGERLHSAGGHSLMLTALQDVCGNDPRAMVRLETAWEGVGGWYR